MHYTFRIRGDGLPGKMILERRPGESERHLRHMNELDCADVKISGGTGLRARPWRAGTPAPQ